MKDAQDTSQDADHFPLYRLLIPAAALAALGLWLLAFAATRIPADLLGMLLLLLSLPLFALLMYSQRNCRELTRLHHSQQHLLQKHQQQAEELQQQQQALQQEIQAHARTHRELTDQRQRIGQAIEASRLGLWDWNLETDSIYHSHFTDIFGYKEDEIPHFMGHLQPLVHPDDYPRLRQALVSALKGHTAHFQCRFRILHKSGEWRWLEDHGEVVDRHEVTGTARRMLGTRRDITEEQEKDDYLQLAWRAFEASGEATYIVDAQSKVIFINQAFVDVTGYSRHEILNHNFWELPCFAKSLDDYKSISRNLRNEGRWEGELTQQRANGELYPQWLRVVRVVSGFQQDSYTIGIFSDMTQRREVEARLNYLAEYDELTGLANRSQFYDRMHQKLAQARLQGEELALLVFDIDRFKAYNNSLGHHAGDQVLKQVAERLSKVLPDAAILARTGGNEFAVLLRAPESRALMAAEYLQQQLHQPFYLDNQELRLTLSLGISCYPQHTHELQVLINQADQARLRCKTLGGNRIQVYNEEIRQNSLEQLKLEQDLRKALERQEIEVYFQPKLELSSGRIIAAEALARWHHPEQGNIPPSVFVPLAERTGLINLLGTQVLEKSCQQAAIWHQQGYAIQVAVNIAAQQVEGGQLMDLVDQLLEKYNLPARLLELELTESTLMEDAEASIIEMTRLRNRGISLAIDDFGTGYSSLSYLQRFPLNVLKIDRSFLISEHGHQNQGTLTRAIIALGHGLGMKVVAEGVEETEQLNELKQLGCDFAQGYIISRPVPADAFYQLLEDYRQSAD